MESLLGKCLFFTSQSLSRLINEKAVEIFAKTSLSPSHAYLLYHIILFENCSPTQLSSALRLSPSTITRFVDKLVVKGFVARQVQGKNSLIWATRDGLKMRKSIENAMTELNLLFEESFGKESLKELALDLADMTKKLEQS